MLTIAPSAAHAITLLVTTSGLPESAGVRLEPASRDVSDPNIVIRFREAPAADDQVIEDGAANVFVDPVLTDDLDDRMLEATTSDNQVTFTLTGPNDLDGD